MSTILTTFDTSTGRDVFRKLVRETVDTTDRTAIVESEKLYNMLTSDKLFERDQRLAMLPPGSPIVEGGRIPMMEPKYGGTKDYEQTEYGEGFRISWKMKKFNQIDLMQKLTKNLAMKLKELKDVELAKLWNSPTATYLGFDGLALASASHTCLDDAGTTFSNLGSAALSVAALESMVLFWKTLKDDQGALAPVDIKGGLLYHAPALEFTVNEILRSSGKPFEISNTYNYMQDRFTPYCYSRLTSSTAWGLANVKHDKYDINCFTTAKEDVMVRDAADNSIDTIVLGHMAFSFGFGDGGRSVYVGNV
jgi:hypothetical protein